MVAHELGTRKINWQFVVRDDDESHQNISRFFANYTDVTLNPSPLRNVPKSAPTPGASLTHEQSSSRVQTHIAEVSQIEFRVLVGPAEVAAPEPFADIIGEIPEADPVNTSLGRLHREYQPLLKDEREGNAAGILEVVNPEIAIAVGLAISESNSELPRYTILQLVTVLDVLTTIRKKAPRELVPYLDTLMNARQRESRIGQIDSAALLFEHAILAVERFGHSGYWIDQIKTGDIRSLAQTWISSLSSVGFSLFGRNPVNEMSARFHRLFMSRLSTDFDLQHDVKMITSKRDPTNSLMQNLIRHTYHLYGREDAKTHDPDYIALISTVAAMWADNREKFPLHSPVGEALLSSPNILEFAPEVDALKIPTPVSTKVAPIQPDILINQARVNKAKQVGLTDFAMKKYSVYLEDFRNQQGGFVGRTMKWFASGLSVQKQAVRESKLFEHYLKRARLKDDSFVLYSKSLIQKMVDIFRSVYTLDDTNT